MLFFPPKDLHISTTYKPYRLYLSSLFNSAADVFARRSPNEKKKLLLLLFVRKKMRKLIAMRGEKKKLLVAFALAKSIFSMLTGLTAAVYTLVAGKLDRKTNKKKSPSYKSFQLFVKLSLSLFLFFSLLYFVRVYSVKVVSYSKFHLQARIY